MNYAALDKLIDQLLAQTFDIHSTAGRVMQ